MILSVCYCLLAAILKALLKRSAWWNKKLGHLLMPQI
jgi:hypothetical protein